jgi:hypothetical protein
MTKVFFTLWSDKIRSRACLAVMGAEKGCRVSIDPPRRTLDQNAKMHAMLRDVMAQRQTNTPMDEEAWKQAMLMAMGHKVEFHQNPFDMTICAVAPRTSKMTVAQCGEAIEFLYAAGAEWRVVWSEPDVWGHKPSIGEK